MIDSLKPDETQSDNRGLHAKNNKTKILDTIVNIICC